MTRLCGALALAFVFAAGWFVTGAMAAHLPGLLERAGATPIEATHHFYHALTLTALYPSAPPNEQAQFATLLEGKLKKLKLWADNCPQNYHNRYALLLAEIARIEGTPADPDRLAVGQKPAAMRQNPETAELDDRGVSDI